MADLTLPSSISLRLDRGPDEADPVPAELRAATRDVGFFYLTGTGIAPELEHRLHRAARDFFALGDDKLAIENVNSPHSRVHASAAERTKGAVDWREQIDIGPERDAVAGGPAFTG
ncbi:2-oxoglutarate and iron-dependent oxygenase domain-containing protein [Microbacterium sp.]|uniref:2-oxoglutarate and iron-dependent oxygenase domain-containing protein n=1 Tax=Microbacterium sp. TaxID=51671 RepID=UPI003A8D51DC